MENDAVSLHEVVSSVNLLLGLYREMGMTAAGSEAPNKYCDYLDSIFTLHVDVLKNIIRDFHSEMEKGLSGTTSSIQMLPAFVGKPEGSEKGRFLAIDLGGTNFRVLAVDLMAGGKSIIFAASKFVIPEYIKQGTGHQLFQFIAESVQVFFEEHEIERNGCYDLAFTFSFPVRQTGINSGVLIKWTKGFTAKGVEGQDVMGFLLAALKEKNITYIRPVAMVNDTVGTLVSKCYSNPSCDIGVILGTGMNACYLEKSANIKKMPDNSGQDTTIINMECGNFDKIPLTPFDLELDINSPNPGAQKMEKIVSGMYLGEIVRIVILDMFQKGLLFNNCDSGWGMNNKGSFTTRQMSIISADNSSGLQQVAILLADKGMGRSAIEDRVILRKICQLVSERSATIAATAISAIATWLDPELRQHHTVGVDGSLYEKFPGYQDVMNDTLASLLGEQKNKVRLEQAKDGSGKGAAVIAAIVAK